jgi:hypothetical protein
MFFFKKKTTKLNYQPTQYALHDHNITASSSGSDNDNHKSLGTDQEETYALTHDAALSSVMLQCRGGTLHNGIHSSTSIRHIGRMTFQCKFVLF